MLKWLENKNIEIKESTVKKLLLFQNSSKNIKIEKRRTWRERVKKYI